MRPSTRRQFLSTGAATWLASLGVRAVPPACASDRSRKPESTTVLQEHGFWDYTTPGAGGMERYQRDDYLRLLDDMAGAGMNSLLIMVKWFTTGYRSRLAWLDQDAQNPVIASDNALLQFALEEAAKRRIRAWLGAVASIFDLARYGGKPHATFKVKIGDGPERQGGIYDPDMPEVIERAAALYDELVTLFPRVDGFLVEIEDCDAAAPHREEPYNHWAANHGRPEYKTLKVALNPRNFNCPPWRDYSTYSRSRLLRAVATTLRGKGFEGDLAMICETGSAPYVALHVTNLEYFHQVAAGWAALTYDYSKWLNRYAMADFCMVEPKKAGLKTYYLPRGVMTWGSDKTGSLPMPLEQSWRLDVEDIRQFRPDGVWWFGSGAVGDGTHVRDSLLRSWGFSGGVDARRRLLEVARGL